MSLRRYFCPLLLFAIAVIPLHSQTATPGQGTVPTIRTKAQLVLVDVVVTNNKGEPVPGLHQKDFEVLEDGKPQTISTFEEHHGAPLTQIKMPPLPPHVYTNFPLTKSADSVNVLLLDALNTPSRDQAYVHAQMIKYLKTIPPGTRVAIFTLASRLRMIQGVTTDSSELLAVLNGDKSNKDKSAALPQPSGLLPSSAENDANQQLIEFLEENDQGPTPKTLADAGVDPIMAMKQFLADTAAFQTQLRIEITLQSFQQLARYLSDVPGRKNVIWFSGSFPVGIFPDSELPDPFNIAATFEQQIRKTADLVTASQIAIYPIAAEGLTTESLYQANASEIGEKRQSMANVDQIRHSRSEGAQRDLNHSAMEELARDTGGQAFYNTNGLNDALAHVVNNGTRYYSLAYSPGNAKSVGNKNDGKYHRIQIKIENNKDTLAYRRGYYADDLDATLATGLKPDSDPLLPLMGRNLPDYTQILYKVLVAPSNPQPPPDAKPVGSNPDMKGPFTRYSVDFAIAVQDLKLDPTTDGARHGSIEVELIAYDREGKPLNFVVTKGDVLLQPNSGPAQTGLQMHKEIDVPKQYVYLRTGIYDLKSSNAGTLGIPLTDGQVAAAK